MDHPASFRPVRAAAWAGLLMLAAGAVQAAQVTLFQLGPSEVMVSACAGLQTGNGWSPGGLVDMIGARSDCQSATTTQPGTTVSRSVAYDELPAAIQASSEAKAQFGELKFGSAFHADTANGLTIGVANAGWNATMTVLPNNAADVGKIALMMFGIHVEGVLHGAGHGNSGTGIAMMALVNDGFFGSAWAAQGAGQLFVPFDLTLDEIVPMSVPIVLGTPFKLGFFAATWSGNSSGFGGPSDASSDFLNTITWQGTGAVSVDGTPIGYTLASNDGIDWTKPFGPQAVPEPSTALLVLAALAALPIRRRGDRARR